MDGPATIRKLCEEVGELAEAVCLGDPRKIQEEAGDCVMVLCHLVREFCDDPSLQTAFEMAVDKCERRSITPD